MLRRAGTQLNISHKGHPRGYSLSLWVKFCYSRHYKTHTQGGSWFGKEWRPGVCGGQQGDLEECSIGGALACRSRSS